jgi:hypothetical protein
MPRFLKEYTVNMVIYVEPDAPFLELENNENVDVIGDMLKGLIYDLDDMTIKEIEVEYTGE